MFMPRRAAATHILSMAQSFTGGGVERSLLRLADEWTAAGRRVTLVVGSGTGPLRDAVPPAVCVIELGRRDYAGLAGLPAIVRTLRPDAIFCPGNHYTAVAAFARLRLGDATPPILAKISNALIRRDQRFPVAQAYRWWLRQHPGFIDHFVAMTEMMRVEALALIGADPARISVIPNPPPVLRPDAPHRPLPDGPLLVGVGRLEPQKRWDRAIEALARLRDRSARLLIIGEGSQRPLLRAKADELGVGDRVLMPGYATEPAPYLARGAAVVLTSDYEGVPGVLREALALGTPVIATESSVAVREIIASPDSGSIVAPDDQDALVAAMNHWISPQRVRPDPLPLPGEHSAAAYLDLFDSLVAKRQSERQR